MVRLIAIKFTIVCPNDLYCVSPYTTFTVLHNKTAKMIKKWLLAFTFFDRSLTDIDVIASVCALKLQIKL